jgi:hypothetical protein
LCGLIALGGPAMAQDSSPVGLYAARFALFVMSVQGQEILARHGFSAPALPSKEKS